MLSSSRGPQVGVAQQRRQPRKYLPHSPGSRKSGVRRRPSYNQRAALSKRHGGRRKHFNGARLRGHAEWRVLGWPLMCHDDRGTSTEAV